ncbi:MAG TPA: phosphohydrolase [Gammaproteobacteria bacterium]|nr:phosphohydrolase [Gammaproteobacteria bacterium]
MSWILTYTGQQFDLLQPKADQISVTDIAHALAMTCRFGGHVERFYSVAQHSVWVSKQVPDEKHAFAALLHDAAEAYVSDVVRPLKQWLPEFREIEDRVQAAIAERFGLSVDELEHPEIKKTDMRALATERRDLMAVDNSAWPCLSGVETSMFTIKPLSARKAEQAFLDRFRYLVGLA